MAAWGFSLLQSAQERDRNVLIGHLLASYTVLPLWTDLRRRRRGRGGNRHKSRVFVQLEDFCLYSFRAYLAAQAHYSYSSRWVAFSDEDHVFECFLPLLIFFGQHHPIFPVIPHPFCLRPIEILLEVIESATPNSIVFLALRPLPLTRADIGRPERFLFFVAG